MEDKVAAIYALREAAQRHGKLEEKAEKKPAAVTRDTLLDSRIELEQKTQDAIESCVHCGRTHVDDDPDCRDESGNGNGSGKVIPLDFARHKKETGAGNAGPDEDA